MRLRGKAALATDTGQGFGFCIAEAFVREARIARLDLKGDVDEAVVKRLGGGTIVLAADVSNRADVLRAALGFRGGH